MFSLVAWFLGNSGKTGIREEVKKVKRESARHRGEE